ncbi:MAG: NAD-dependent dehydratase, partial [Rhodospirillales bacterium]|nr:NAD-dependent dehydratase [Rhodospirillales bacterium]
PLAHAEDIARAAVAAVQAEKGIVHGQAFNVGNTNENFRVRELAELVGEIVPEAAIIYADDASPDRRHYRVSFEKIARELTEFRPQWTVYRGAQSLFETISAMGLSTEDFEGPRYNRLDHLQMLLRDGRLNADMRYARKPGAEKRPERRVAE